MASAALCLAASNSPAVASPSANRSATATALRDRSSASRCQTTWRQQAQAKSRTLRELALPRKWASIGLGSVQSCHSASVTPLLLVQQQVNYPTTPLVDYPLLKAVGQN